MKLYRNYYEEKKSSFCRLIFIKFHLYNYFFNTSAKQFTRTSIGFVFHAHMNACLNRTNFLFQIWKTIDFCSPQRKRFLSKFFFFRWTRFPGKVTQWYFFLLFGIGAMLHVHVIDDEKSKVKRCLSKLMICFCEGETGA